MNPYLNRDYALYFLNNWCGLLPLWSSLHLGDQGRHGTSECYKNWSQKFSSRECVKDPPRTQGIVEFHHKSVKHISMNSKRERIDSVVANLFVAKKSKMRQLEIVKSRKSKNKDDQEKIKDVFPKKIATEKWSKRKKKISAGPGFFQTSQGFNLVPKTKTSSRPKEAWEKLPIIANGGEFVSPHGDKTYLSNTCTIDNFLQILLVHYSLNMNLMSKLFESDDHIVGKVRNIVQFLLTHDFDSAKYYWLVDICGLEPKSNPRCLSAFGTDKNMLLQPI